MTNIFKKAMEAYGQNMKMGDVIDAIRGAKEEHKDPRYNEPKGKHKATEEQIDDAIESTEIYKRAKELILKAQRGQIGYGLDKYPETLSADVWDILETINHILDESIDKTHYLVMLQIHLERIAQHDIMRSKELEVLSDFILREFPDEIGLGNPKEGESAVEVAIRLLAQQKYADEYKYHLNNQVYMDGKFVAGVDLNNIEVTGTIKGMGCNLGDFDYSKMADVDKECPYDPMLGKEAMGYCMADVEATRAMWEACQSGKVYTDAEAPEPKKIYVDGRLLADSALHKLAMSGADLDGDIVHVDALDEYIKADIEATHKFISGITSDEEYTHEYTNYINDKPKFTIVTQPDHESGTQDVSINLTLKHGDGFDALVYTLNNELNKMKERGLFK